MARYSSASISTPGGLELRLLMEFELESVSTPLSVLSVGGLLSESERERGEGENEGDGERKERERERENEGEREERERKREREGKVERSQARSTALAMD